MASRLLIRGGCVLTLGAKTKNHPVADVLIEDGKIAEVGRGIRSRGAEVVDASDTIVMPGFVDCHRHAWRALFRNAGKEGTGSGYVPEDIYAATLIGLLGAVEAGITTVVDWADVPEGPEFIEAATQAHLDSGLRTVLVHSNASGLNPLAQAFASDDIGAEPDRLAGQWSRARASGVRIHAHAGLPGSPTGGVAALHGRGLLGDDVTLVHCTASGGADLDAVSGSGAHVVITPSSEMAGGLGMPPMQGLIDRGIRPGLGVDDERIAPGDLFAQMRAAISVQHASMFDLKLSGKGSLPSLLTTREVIRYGTIDGARAVGLGGVTGSIEPGKAADLIVLRTDRVNISPVNDPIGAVVWGMDTSNLDWVIVGGKPLISAGTPSFDMASARKLAADALQRVTGGDGLVLSGTGGSQ